MTFTLNKKGIKFEIEMENKVDQYGQLGFKFKTNGKEWKRGKDYKDGKLCFYGNVEIVKGLKVAGVMLEDKNLVEQLNAYKTEAIQARKAEEERIKNLRPEKVRFAIGGDSHKVYVVADIETEYQDMYTQPAIIERLEKEMNKDWNKVWDAMKVARRLDLHTGLYTETGWYEIELEKLVEMFIEEEKKKEKKQVSKEQFTMEMEIIKQGYIPGSEDEYYALVKVIDTATGESVKLYCRNIFDFGFVINPADKAGLAIKKDGRWVWDDGKIKEMTELAARAVEWVHKHPPISKAIRM